MTVVERAASVDEVLALFERWGTHRYDEEVTQLDHALQTAALARAAGASDELVAAALLHDVGHLLALRDGLEAPDGEDRHHEARGARYLAGLFGPAVTGPIALHVRAKRYLAATDPDYTATLSAGSTRSLAVQGGPMDGDECRAFSTRDGAADAIALRRWDDGGKLDGLRVDSLETYRDVLVATQLTK